MARKTRKPFGCFGVLLLFVVALAIFPILEVLYVRFFNPPITTLMIVRRAEAMATKRYRGDINYRWIPLNQVPDDFLDGVWQMEDSRFFSHEGFDPVRPVTLPVARTFLGQESPGSLLHLLDGASSHQAAHPGVVCEYDRTRRWDLRNRRSRGTLLSDACSPTKPPCLCNAGRNASIPARLGSSQSQSKTSSPLFDRSAPHECRRFD
jgi:hypothetical protein